MSDKILKAIKDEIIKKYLEKEKVESKPIIF